MNSFSTTLLHPASIAALALLALMTAFVLWERHRRSKESSNHRIHCKSDHVAHTLLATPKPPWVRAEVLRLKALMPHNGCCKISATFNHMYRHRRVSVGKSFGANVLKAEGFRLEEIRRQIRRRKPRPVPKNLLWGLDLTFVQKASEARPILGLIDHGTRACMDLRALPSKSSVVILRTLLNVIELFGKPKTIRTDNESIFTSALFRLGLAILGIRHQRTAPFAPWQNGRIERFFGTLKEMLRLRASICDAQIDLDLFRIWYNHVRPHQNLSGHTPAQAWSGQHQPRGRPWFFSAWEGLLTGYYFPS